MFLNFSESQMILWVILAVLVFFLNSYFVFQAPAILNFEGLKCPFCFGESFCHLVDKVEVKLTPLDYILDKLDRRTALFGTFENKQIVIKKLATSDERYQLDERISDLFDSQFDYYNFKFREEARRFYYESLLLLNSSYHDPSYKLKWCPTLNGVTKFFDPIVEKNYYVTLPLHIWTSLVLNPEPLILQVFKSEDGWPVPKYIGSCGQTEFVEYCGKTLDNYYNHPWQLRIHIAGELLQMADIFTFKNPKIGVYLRDLSYDNVALDSELRVRVIDLEHVILVDKNAGSDMPETWESQHVSEHFACQDCMTYSPMIICSHHISDHNFYAVCKVFFHSEDPNDYGLLHSLPNDTHHDKIQMIREYARECVQPSKNHSRFEIAEKLKGLIFEIKSDQNFDLQEFKNMDQIF